MRHNGDTTARKMSGFSNLLEKLDPNKGIIGINPSLEVFEGYDARIHAASLSDDGCRAHTERLTRTEKLELADEMIRRWTAYRNLAT